MLTRPLRSLLFIGQAGPHHWQSIEGTWQGRSHTLLLKGIKAQEFLFSGGCPGVRVGKATPRLG